MNNISKSEWDSNFFEIPVLKIDRGVNSINVFNNLLKIAERESVLTYCFVNPSDKRINEQAIGSGGIFVDKKTIFRKKISKRISSTSHNVFFYKENFPTNELYELSIESGVYSRFNTDKNFKKGDFENLYRVWIEKSLIDKDFCTGVLVYKEKKSILGFVTFKLDSKKSVATIGLIAVSQKSRGRGIATSLLKYLEHVVRKSGGKEIYVTTQGSNIPACMLYKKNGYKIYDVLNTYHFWFKDKNRDNLAKKIPYNKPILVGKELEYINNAQSRGQLSGGGYYTKKCQKIIEDQINCRKCLLTHSCTGALEMAAILSEVGVGDEVIMPSYTFVSTANAFVLRGATPVFVDINQTTLNIDPGEIEKAVSSKTKAIVVVHYAGVPCDMDRIMDIAHKNGLIVVEDAAQAYLTKYKNRNLGSIGDFATFSFHETKNVISGEGGALCINNNKFVDRAEVIWEKGTNRSSFMRGEENKYTWVDVGSSFLPSELVSAFLFAQLETADEITKKRLKKWNIYYELFEKLEKEGYAKRPDIKTKYHNGHIFYLLLGNEVVRNELINYLKLNNILTVFHYVPLHSSPAGKKYGRYVGDMKNTDKISKTIIRLPLFNSLDISDQKLIKDSIIKFFTKI